ncbi:MAG: hypothetical protein H6737_13095 [Alphaproteobacteria bacterium]|nr:hypothetical protein [Alphaproteobacteria bacterium]
MSVQFTADGYIEPMKPRMGGIAIGAVLALASFPAGWFVSWCLAAPLLVVGLGMMANERGQRRYRVTRTKLLIEDEPMIRGFVIGPIRNRIPWDEVEKVEREGQALKLVRKAGGEPLLLGQGGSDQELEKLLNRIDVALEE